MRSHPTLPSGVPLYRHRRGARPWRGLGALMLLAANWLVSPRAHADSVTLVPTADTRVSPGEDNNNNSLVSIAVYHEGGNIQNSLVYFNLSSIPSNAKILSASLRLKESTTFFDGNGQPTWAFRVTQPWSETEATGLRATTSTLWAVNGGDYVGTGGVQAASPYGSAYDVPGDPTTVIMDLKSLVKAWVEQGVANYGLMLSAPNSNHHHFWAREQNGGSTAAQLTIQYVAPPFTYYVRPGGDNNADGLTWATAKATPDSACQAAENGDQIWVAAGSYNGGPLIKQGVRVYGGFTGVETQLSQRDWMNNVTTFAGPDIGVQFLSGTGGGSVLDGVTITGCNRYALIGNQASCTLQNCRIAGNNASDHVTIFNGCPSVAVLHCEIANNQSHGYGGSLLIGGWTGRTTAIVDDCNIHDNSGDGGTDAVKCDYVDDLTFTNNRVEKNTFADVPGLRSHMLRKAVVRKNKFLNNTGAQAGGLFVFVHKDDIVRGESWQPDWFFDDNDFSGNTCTTPWSTGGLAMLAISTGGHVVVNNNRITGNNDPNPGGVGGLQVDASCPVEVTKNTISGNSGIGLGGAVLRSMTQLTFDTNVVENNEGFSDWSAGGFALDTGGATGQIAVTGNTFRGNQNLSTGGKGGLTLSSNLSVDFLGNLVENNIGNETGGVALYGAPANLMYNRFLGNQSTGSGSRCALFIWQAGGTVANNLFAHNSGPGFIPGVDGSPTIDPGTAIYLGGNGSFVNNTVADNFARGLVVDSQGSHPVTNNWVAFNAYWGIEYWGPGGVNPGLIDYNHFWQNGWGDWNVPAVSRGPNNYYDSPVFLNRAANDYHCGPESGGIGFGLNTAAVGPIDLDGSQRIQQGAVDIGCYESGSAKNTVPPVIAVSYSSAPNGSGWYNTDVTVLITGEDDLKAIEWLDYYGTGGQNKPYNYTVFEVPNVGTPTKSVVYTQEGVNTGKASGGDNSENVGNVVDVTVKIDKTAPATTASTTGDKPVNVTLAASDNVSGVATTWYQVDAGAATQYLGTFGVAQAGSHTVKFWSVDAAGNVEATKSVSIFVGDPNLSGTEWSAIVFSNSLSTGNMFSYKLVNNGTATAKNVRIESFVMQGQTPDSQDFQVYSPSGDFMGQWISPSYRVGQLNVAPGGSMKGKGIISPPRFARGSKVVVSLRVAWDGGSQIFTQKLTVQ